VNIPIALTHDSHHIKYDRDDTPHHGITIELDDMQESAIEEDNDDEDKSIHGTPSSTSSTSTSSATPISFNKKENPWIQIVRVETLWDRTTCHQSFEMVLRNLELSPRTVKQVRFALLNFFFLSSFFFLHIIDNVC
jgi:hypothetical protein